MQVEQNKISVHTDPDVMFIDMNSFFASCEQQVNYYLRGRPVAVCAYPGKFGAIIAPSIEAKKHGIKTGMRLNDAMKLCPGLVPLETTPDRYREYHKAIMNVLRKYSEDVIPKSIDEAVINFASYKLVHKDLTVVARKIKQDIRNDVGDWLQCSIGIAPNAFLAKLASDIEKPDGLVVISPGTIDDVLKKLTLIDLPGIGPAMAEKLQRAGINTPLQLRHSTPQHLKQACKSIVGLYWHCRLNFSEVDLNTSEYKSMQAMRQISSAQRRSLQGLWDLLTSLCTTLESRMIKQGVFCKEIFFNANYVSGKNYKETIHCENPVQDASEILKLIKNRMEAFQKANKSEAIINTELSSLGVSVSHFIAQDALQLDLFENLSERAELRKAIYGIRDKFGKDKIMKASELQDEPVFKDAIGFGSVKHLY